jgi:DNA-binding NarL/FixJ family response regulator
MYKILLIDDHPVVREGIREVLVRTGEFAVVDAVQTGADALRSCRTMRPDAAVLDISLGRESGLSLPGELRRIVPDLKILVLSMHDELVFAERALRAGANGYVMKDSPSSAVTEALRRILTGKTYVSEAVSERLFQTLSGPRARQERSGLERLSDRELEILRLIGQGQQTKVIAAQLGITTKTIETYRARIKQKLGMESSSELMVAAVNWLRDGFIDPDRED